MVWTQNPCWFKTLCFGRHFSYDAAVAACLTYMLVREPAELKLPYMVADAACRVVCLVLVHGANFFTKNKQSERMNAASPNGSYTFIPASVSQFVNRKRSKRKGGSQVGKVAFVAGNKLVACRFNGVFRLSACML